MYVFMEAKVHSIDLSTTTGRWMGPGWVLAGRYCHEMATTEKCGVVDNYEANLVVENNYIEKYKIFMDTQLQKLSTVFKAVNMILQ